MIAPHWMSDLARSRRRRRTNGNWVTQGAGFPTSDDSLIWSNAAALNQPYRERIASRLGQLGPMRFIDDPESGVESG